LRREYPDVPLVAVGVLVVDMKKGEVLLIRRGSEPGKGKYSIPGGAVEVGERLVDAARRELMEEVSIECRILGIINVDEIIVNGGRPRWHYVLIDFLAEPLNKDIRASSDALEAKWVRLVDALSLDLTRSTRRLLESFIKMLETRRIYLLDPEGGWRVLECPTHR